MFTRTLPQREIKVQYWGIIEAEILHFVRTCKICVYVYGEVAYIEGHVRKMYKNRAGIRFFFSKRIFRRQFQEGAGGLFQG